MNPSLKIALCLLAAILLLPACSGEKKVSQARQDEKRERKAVGCPGPVLLGENTPRDGSVTITYAYKDTAWHPIPRGEMVNWAFHNSNQVIPLQAVEDSLCHLAHYGPMYVENNIEMVFPVVMTLTGHGLSPRGSQPSEGYPFIDSLAHGLHPNYVNEHTGQGAVKTYLQRLSQMKLYARDHRPRAFRIHFEYRIYFLEE